MWFVIIQGHPHSEIDSCSLYCICMYTLLSASFPFCAALRPDRTRLSPIAVMRMCTPSRSEAALFSFCPKSKSVFIKTENVLPWFQWKWINSHIFFPSHVLKPWFYPALSVVLFNLTPSHVLLQSTLCVVQNYQYFSLLTPTAASELSLSYMLMQMTSKVLPTREHNYFLTNVLLTVIYCILGQVVFLLEETDNLPRCHSWFSNQVTEWERGRRLETERERQTREREREVLMRISDRGKQFQMFALQTTISSHD